MADDKFININVRDYINEKVAELDARWDIVQKRNIESIIAAEKTMDRRLEGMNEFRAQLDKQTRTFVTRDDLTATNRLIDERLYTITDKYDKLADKYDKLSRVVNIGIGAALILEIVLNVIVYFVIRSFI